MTRSVVCITPAGRLPRATAAAIEAALPGVPLTTRSLSRYLAAPGSGSRILLVPAGASVSRDLAFLRRAARRLLWPAPSADFRDAIGGLRTEGSSPRAEGARRPRRQARGTATALLLEGRVDPVRMRAILASGAPQDWIVESPRHVALPAGLERALERAGVRWSALEPVELVAVCVGAALAKTRARWRRLLPPRTAVWIRPETSSRSARPRRS